jgi:hypothetical protein
MLALRHLLLAALLVAAAAGRSPAFDDDDDDSGVGRNDQHVATVPLEHSFGVRCPGPAAATRREPARERAPSRRRRKRRAIP